MLGKLIKYELKACGRTFLPLYGAIILMCLIVGFSMNTEIFLIREIAMVVLFGLFISLAVLTVMITIQRFRKNLLEDEGYLMFTLPVSSKELIFSKYIVSFIYALLSVCVSSLSFVIMVLIASKNHLGEIPFLDIFNDLSRLFDMISPMTSTIILSIMLSIVSYSIFILILYMSISMGQLPVFNKHRNVVAFISFFVINIGMNTIYTFMANILSKFIDTSNMENIIINNTLEINEFAATMNGKISTLLGFNLVFYVVFAATIFWGISYILDKKLNLE